MSARQRAFLQGLFLEYSNIGCQGKTRIEAADLGTLDSGCSLGNRIFDYYVGRMIVDLAARRAANSWMPNIHMFGEGFFVDIKAYLEDAQVTNLLSKILIFWSRANHGLVCSHMRTQFCWKGYADGPRMLTFSA